MPLPNRVDPFGRLLSIPSRGQMMGNRGGRFHDPHTQTLNGRIFATRRWICCALTFRNRRRAVWGTGYTELFFLDEVTALAAGHRPCFECRRADAKAFQDAWHCAHGHSARASDMDRILHAERLDPTGSKRLHLVDAERLPDGAMIACQQQCLALREGMAYPWSSTGYGAPVPRPQGAVVVLTPPAILACLSAGYRPRWADPRRLLPSERLAAGARG